MPPLRNNVNYASGLLLPVGLFVLAVASGLGETFEGLELVSWCTGLWAASCASFAFLARPYVALGGDVIEVRNPLSRWRIPGECIRGVTVGAGNYPRLDLGDRQVRVWALEESLLTTLRGGFEKIDVLRAATSARTTDRTPTRQPDVLDLPVALITAVWTSYLVASLLVL